ncbi:hypothetical protein T484DRAFT_1812805 [Baffinella frigidus]|nr:hypothetical protein T484DRAFT_1812805 [Cryptophyta sp. CCMP2293]
MGDRRWLRALERALEVAASRMGDRLRLRRWLRALARAAHIQRRVAVLSWRAGARNAQRMEERYVRVLGALSVASASRGGPVPTASGPVPPPASGPQDPAARLAEVAAKLALGLAGLARRGKPSSGTPSTSGPTSGTARGPASGRKSGAGREGERALLATFLAAMRGFALLKQVARAKAEAAGEGAVRRAEEGGARRGFDALRAAAREAEGKRCGIQSADRHSLALLARTAMNPTT